MAVQAQAPPSPDALFDGIVKPRRQVVLRAPLVARVQNVLVEESQVVPAGELLVQMDDAVQAAMVDHADASLRQAELILSSTRQMHRSQAATDFELSRAELEVEQAHAALRLERARLAQYRIEAPFPGHVIRLIAREGATVGENDQVLLFAEITSLEAEFHLPAAWYAHLRVGETYPLEAGEPIRRVLEARCKTIDPLFDPASQTTRVVFSIPNDHATLPAGFIVQWQGRRETANSPLEGR